MLTLARSVLEQLDVELVLKRVLEAARDLTGAQYAALGVLDEDRRQLDRFLTLGIDEPTRRRVGPLPTGRGVLGELIRNPRPLRMPDVGSHPYSYGFPVAHPPMGSFLGVPILIGDAPFGNLYLTEKQGAPEFTDEDERAAVLLADFAGVAIDHARKFSGSEAQRLQLQRTVSALDATIQIARALGGETDLNAILELVAKRGRALVAARTLIIELLDGGELVLAAGAGELPPGLIGRRVPLRDTVASQALRTGQVERLADPANRRRFDQHGIGHLGLSAQDGLVVPLVFRERPYGVLVALDHLEEGNFTRDHQRLLEAFAASAATGVATAQTAADEHRRHRLAATEAERGRWARELHDETLQALGNLRLVLSSAKRTGDPRAMEKAIDQALGQIEGDIAGLRALITELRPAALDALGLEPALEALVERVGSNGLAVDSSVQLRYENGNAADRLDADLETAVYRIVQEALTNVLKHGSATRTMVEVVEDDRLVHVTVRDDGAGFDTSMTASGFGLAGMRERSELLGGEIVVHSSPGAGTKVSVALPVRRRSSTAPAAVVVNGTPPLG